MLTLLIDRIRVIHTGRTNELRYYDTLRTVDDERTVLGHQGEISEEYLGGLKLACLLICKSDADLHMSIVGNTPVLTFLNGISGRGVEGVVGKLNSEISRKINNRGNIAENLVKTLLQKPLVRVLLNLDKVGHFGGCLNL